MLHTILTRARPEIRRVVKRLAYGAFPQFALSRQSRRGTEMRDMEPSFASLYAECSSYSTTSVERMYALYKAVEFVLQNDIPGDFVECGVWRGGSAMLIALALRRAQCTDRHIWLYDTFSGMTQPTTKDVSQFEGNARQRHEQSQTEGHNSWCYASLDDVTANLARTGYPLDRMHFIRGRVEETLPVHAPEKIALLRLDTDWYESTKSELIHLYPRLVRRGILILDDYGHWEGAREATDEYFQTIPERPHLCRIDYTGRIAVKP